MITIGKTDWNAIKAEYIGGGISQRELAEKHGVSPDYLMQKANKEHWKQDRDEAIKKGLAKSQQKAADAIADNAMIASRIRTKLLQKLEKEIDALPDIIGSETRNSVTETDHSKGKRIQKEAVKAFKLRDLAAAYKDLTADIVSMEQVGNELLQSLYDLERRSAND